MSWRAWSFLAPLLLLSVADAQTWTFIPRMTETYYNVSSFKTAISQRQIAGVNFNTRAFVQSCQIRMNVGGFQEFDVKLSNCTYSGSNFSAIVSQDPVEGLSITPTESCDLKDPVLEITHCPSSPCSSTSIDRLSNSANSFATATSTLSSPQVLSPQHSAPQLLILSL